MRRWRVLPAIAILVLAISFTTLHGRTAATKKPNTAGTSKPNILFILTDDQRWDALRCYGNDVIRTPNFDRLATEGARLDAFYVASPLCCPSRAGFLSGLYPHQNGVVENKNMPDLKPGTPTVATYLNKAGYITGFVGKAHLGGDPRRWDFKECPVWIEHGGGSAQENPTLMVDGEMKTVPGQITQIFTEAALQFLEKHKGDRWFLWFATTAPHSPYIGMRPRPYKPWQIKPPPGWPPGEKLTHTPRLASYYTTITMLDEHVGRVLRKLDELGLAKNTLVITASDNGFMFGSHGERAKQVWFDEAARVPALVRWPGKIKPGTRTASPLVNVDFLPTVLEAAGARTELPKIFEAKSMIPALTGGKPLRTAAYSEVKQAPHIGGGYWQMVRAQRWKYVRFESGEEHLYDMKEDPSELKDLVGTAQAAEVLREMQGKLTAWLKATPSETTPQASPAPPVAGSSGAGVCCSP
jgi:choline-sulfatase